MDFDKNGASKIKLRARTCELHIFLYSSSKMSYDGCTTNENKKDIHILTSLPSSNIFYLIKIV